MEHVSKTTNIPPKHGLSRAQQVVAQRTTEGTDKCPAEETCKRLGTCIEGLCAKRPLSTPPCQVSTIKLLDQLVNKN